MLGLVRANGLAQICRRIELPRHQNFQHCIVGMPRLADFTGSMAISARLLKAIYFSDLDFLDDKLGSHSSQIWQAVLEGWDPLKVGLIRSIGDGKTTNGSSENWLPRHWRTIAEAKRAMAPPT
jgi:hypothetical protein